VTRLAVTLAAALFAVLAAVNLVRDARLASHNAEPMAETLARYAANAPGVVIVFQPEDCLRNGEMTRRWNSLAGTPGLRVEGLVTGSGISPAQRKIFTETGLRMKLGTISSEDASLLGGKLGYTRTPFAIVLDGQGRIAASFPAGQNVPPEVVATLISGS
jgi:hypothetical protein